MSFYKTSALSFILAAVALSGCSSHSSKPGKPVALNDPLTPPIATYTVAAPDSTPATSTNTQPAEAVVAPVASATPLPTTTHKSTVKGKKAVKGKKSGKSPVKAVYPVKSSS